MKTKNILMGESYIIMRIFNVLGLLVLVLASCGEGPETKDAIDSATVMVPPHRLSGEEWFWADRLAGRPAALPKPAYDPDLEKSLDLAMEQAAGLDPDAAMKAVAPMFAKGRALIPCLVKYCKHENRTLRWVAVTGLSRIGGPASLQPLMSVLRDEWDAVAAMAVTGLSHHAEPWIIPRLLKTLGPYPVDFNPHLIARVKSAALLAKLGNYSGVPFLIKILKDNTPAADPEREWVENPRLNWEKEEALLALKALSGRDYGFNADASVFEQAKAALQYDAWWKEHHDAFWMKATSLDEPLLEAKVKELVVGLASFQARNADGARYCLTKLGPPVFPYLEEALKSQDFYQRFHSLDVIIALTPQAGNRAEAWSRTIESLLVDSAPAVRMKAVRTLGYLAQPGSIPGLESALADADPDVSLCAIGALGRIRGARAQSLLESIHASDASAQKQVEAKAALVRCSPEYIDTFLSELLQADPIRQEYALQKVIDLLNDDLGFDSEAPLAEREEKVRLLAARLEELPR